MNTDLNFSSHRSAVYGRRGMCATSQPLASSAGMTILDAGGSAADAAVAIAAALNVTEPTSTGLGGDCFALYYLASEQKVYGLNGSGRSPSSLSLSRIMGEGLLDNLPPTHPYTITVPGACAGWLDLHERFGILPRQKVFEPAVTMAESGFPVAPVTAYFWDRAARNLLSRALNGHQLTLDGRSPQAGEIFRNPGLARTMRLIAENGKNAFYHGIIAEAIETVVNQAGGCLSVNDLSSHSSTWIDPIYVDYHGLRVWECPPNGQGLAALIALNILKGFNLHQQALSEATRFHLQIESLRLAFADAFHYIADPDITDIPVSGLLSEAYAYDRRKLIDWQKALKVVQHGNPPASSDTVYFCVVDEAGNACSFIGSNYMGFGTGIVPSGWGFTLQNRGYNFSLDPSSPNVLAPGKRPYTTIIPAMATYTETDTLHSAFGVMGGFMQPQGHVQVVLGMLDRLLDPQEVLGRPRFSLTPTSDSGHTLLEAGITTQTMEDLSEMGHPVEMVHGMARSAFGRGQIIQRDPLTGVFCGGTDPRADGIVIAQY